MRDVIIGMRDKSKRIAFDQLSEVLGNLKELRVVMGYNAMHAMGLRFLGQSQADPKQVALERFDKASSVFLLR